MKGLLEVSSLHKISQSRCVSPMGVDFRPMITLVLKFDVPSKQDSYPRCEE